MINTAYISILTTYYLTDQLYNHINNQSTFAYFICLPVSEKQEISTFKNFINTYTRANSIHTHDPSFSFGLYLA